MIQTSIQPVPREWKFGLAAFDKSVSYVIVNDIGTPGISKSLSKTMAMGLPALPRLSCLFNHQNLRKETASHSFFGGKKSAGDQFWQFAGGFPHPAGSLPSRPCHVHFFKHLFSGSGTPAAA